jgi:hypothetical protein
VIDIMPQRRILCNGSVYKACNHLA